MDWNIDGYWKINNKGDEHVGRLYVNQDKGIIYLTIYFNGEELFASILALPLEIEFINGRLSSGAKLTLLNCKRHGMKTVFGSRNEFSYTAQFFMNGCNFDKPEDIVFSKIYFQLSNIVKWGGVSKFDIDFDVDENSEFKMSSNFVDPINIYANDEFDVSYVLGSSKFSMDTLIEKFEYEQRPQICIKSKTAQNINFFLDKLECVKRLIDVALGGKTGIIAIHAYSPTILDNVDESFQREIEIIHRYPKEDYTYRYSWHEYLFTLPTLIEHANLKNWFENYALLEPTIELYVEDLRSTDMSINRRFLGIVQALETYHSRIICNGDSIVIYQKRIEAIIGNTSEADHAFYRSMLLDKCKSRIPLVSRIFDLVLANFDIWFETADYKREEFAKVVADTRHYLIHYNINEKDKALAGEDLYTAYEVLQYILIYYLLNELGFSREYVHNKIGEKQSSLSTSLMLRNQDRANKN